MLCVFFREAKLFGEPLNGALITACLDSVPSIQQTPFFAPTVSEI